MKQNKIKLNEREVKFTSRCRLDVTLMSWERRKQMVYAKKKWLLWFFKWNSFSNWL